MNQLEQATHRPRNLQHDLQKLKTLAFQRYAICASVVREFHERRAAVDAHPAAELLWNIYDWLLTPYCLWPIEFRGLAKFALEKIQNSTPIQNSAKAEDKAEAQTARQFFDLLQLIDPPPPEETQSVIAEHERDVESGRQYFPAPDLIVRISALITVANCLPPFALTVLLFAMCDPHSVLRAPAAHPAC